MCRPSRSPRRLTFRQWKRPRLPSTHLPSKSIRPSQSRRIPRCRRSPRATPRFPAGHRLPSRHRWPRSDRDRHPARTVRRTPPQSPRQRQRCPMLPQGRGRSPSACLRFPPEPPSLRQRETRIVRRSQCSRQERPADLRRGPLSHFRRRNLPPGTPPAPAASLPSMVRPRTPVAQSCATVQSVASPRPFAPPPPGFSTASASLIRAWASCSSWQTLDSVRPYTSAISTMFASSL